MYECFCWIEELTDTFYRSNFPYTQYNVRVIQNIKGDLAIDTIVKVNKEGGISEDSSQIILFKDDVLPDVGKYYIFNVREKTDDGSFTASGVNTVILIDDIDTDELTIARSN